MAGATPAPKAHTSSVLPPTSTKPSATATNSSTPANTPSQGTDGIRAMVTNIVSSAPAITRWPTKRS